MTVTQDPLMMPVQYLKGVGPRRAAVLKELGIEDLQDLLYHLPRGWEDRHETRDLSRPPPSGKMAVKAQVLSTEVIPFRGRGGLSLFKARVRSAGGILDALWFKRSTPRYDVFMSLKTDFQPGKSVWIVGRAENTLLNVQEIQVDEYYPIEDPRTPLHVDRLVPVYPLTEGLSGRFMRELIYQALLKAVPGVKDLIPAGVLKSRGLPPLSRALWQVHFPFNEAEREAGRRHLAYLEFFLLETALVLKRRQIKQVYKSFRYALKRHLLTPFRERMGFEFTRSQKRVISEIFRDMQGPYPMTRLLQGDVGSGKTVVAISALLLAVENGYQGALMAPTEILAEQHYLTLQRFLKGLPVRVVILTSKNTRKERARFIKEIRDGQVDIVVGTHAILGEEVAIPRLSLAVIDEQHRFGVRQRAQLRQKGMPPDLLVMTATPIPRTLALTLYGDLDISTLNELPPGRRPVITKVLGEKEAFAALRREVESGHQGYVVYPVIEESSRTELKAATLEAERLKREVFPDFRIELLHGQMRPAKKDAIMESFSRGEIDILVATPVIEIGMDVSNATVMVVQHPERFGLASLHQLRGRVGRSPIESYCFLVGEARGLAEERIETLCRTHDGFEISEDDMRQRGPGEILGTEQHGEWTLRAGNFLTDLPLIKQAKEDSAKILEEDPSLLLPEHEPLRTRLVEQYQKKWKWFELS